MSSALLKGAGANTQTTHRTSHAAANSTHTHTAHSRPSHKQLHFRRHLTPGSLSTERRRTCASAEPATISESKLPAAAAQEEEPPPTPWWLKESTPNVSEGCACKNALTASGVVSCTHALVYTCTHSRTRAVYALTEECSLKWRA